MWLGASAAGNIVRIRVDVREETARAVEALVAREPPATDSQALPVHLDEYTELLGAEAPVEEVRRGLTYVFPDAVHHEHGTRVVSSETPEGTQLLARLRADGMPAELMEMGFVDTTHLWAPWCAALDAGTVVSIACTARLSSIGAEVGVATVPASRGRGFAAAATVEWASLPSLEGHVLFYSTNAENISSQRVADRLELQFVGPSLSIR